MVVGILKAWVVYAVIGVVASMQTKRKGNRTLIEINHVQGGGVPSGKGLVLGMYSDNKFYPLRVTDDDGVFTAYTCLNLMENTNECEIEINGNKIMKDGAPLQIKQAPSKEELEEEIEQESVINRFEGPIDDPNCPAPTCTFKIKKAAAPNPIETETKGGETKTTLYNIFADDGVSPLFVRAGEGPVTGNMKAYIYFGEARDSICDINFCKFAIEKYKTAVSQWGLPVEQLSDAQKEF
eukprot:CAMPEP_0185272446 /NCGR_PEP_ID=MMETSP1359-20130426/47194_1 /TAXON_ID=552665 /ORGANISM="Bigelowiella longifila, Strain CCMP242" /LENGTH=237 /DNA_ID=CAMNT_0027864719 /DNA_START=70 /DNA_END=780 /DNA_ORIENTATION=-